MMERIAGLTEPEGIEVASRRVRQERPPGAEPCPKGGLDVGRLDADRDETRVGDLRLVLKRHEATKERPLLRAPESAEEVHERGIARDQIGQKAGVSVVVG